MYLRKLLRQSLQIFIEGLDGMKFGLPPGLRIDKTIRHNIHHRTHSARKDHLVFTKVYDRFAPAVDGLVSILRASTSGFDRLQLKQKNAAENHIFNRQ